MKKNVILLAMSTLPVNQPKMNAYSFEEDFFCLGISQLEAGTKLILSQLAKENKKADRIIVLNTKETEDKCSSNYCSESAYEFYKNRIIAYIRNEEYNPFGSVLSDYANKTRSETRWIDQVNYSEEEIVSLFYPIPESKPDFYLKAVETIVRWDNADKLPEIDLYQDMQGGARTGIFQINAITQLLESYHVTVKVRYAVPNFNFKLPVQQIKDTSRDFESYELVTAMEVFRNYGWGQELINYLNKKKTQNERDRKLVYAIQQASDGIRLCNMAEFEDALKNIDALSEEFNDEYQTDIDIVFQEIKKDYDQLLKYPDSHYLERVKWCCKKGFVQQALTIIESELPSSMFQEGKDPLLRATLISQRYLAKDEEDCNNWIDENLIPLTGKKSLESLLVKKKMKASWESMSNWILENWARRIVMDKANGNAIYLPLNGNLLESWEMCVQDIADKGEETYNLMDFKVDPDRDKEGKIKENYRKKEFILKIELKPEVAAEIRYFTKLHMSLKNQRNKANHGAKEGRYSIEALTDAIGAYIALGEKLGL